jgi:hypothetical protein
MRNFGYLETGPDDSETLYTKEAVQEAIKKVQLFGGLEVTGELNEETRNLLKSPRRNVWRRSALAHCDSIPATTGHHAEPALQNFLKYKIFVKLRHRHAKP